MTFAAPRLQLLESPNEKRFKGGLRDLFVTLDDLLASGGDDRLSLDPITRLNESGCGPSPSHMVAFASCTASPISERGYEHAGLAREELMRSAIAVGLEEALETRLEEMREELKAHLLLPSAVDVIFSPSAADSMLHALALAKGKFGAPMTTVVVGADHADQRTLYAARGRHFGRFTASGVTVRRDTPVAGLAVNSVAIMLADETGLERRPDVDAIVLDRIAAVIADGASVLLRIMDVSALGWCGPSNECLDEITRRWPDDVMVLVDADQMRTSRIRIARYLERGYLVQIAGSTFFGGPAFSGALLVPASLSLQENENAAPGLIDYASRNDWPSHWNGFRGHFESRANLGQWLRWEVALEEMRSYFAVPAAFRAMALRELNAGVESLLALSPSLRSIRGEPGDDVEDEEEFSDATVFPFLMHRQGHGISATETRLLHDALSQDVSRTIIGSALDRDILAQTFLLGQPVRIERQNGHPVAALRLAIGARQVTDCFSHDPILAARRLHLELDAIAEAIAKLELLLTHTDVSQLTGLSHGF